jgi:DNA (cytosine-5)-methyltransferase 1
MINSGAFCWKRAMCLTTWGFGETGIVNEVSITSASTIFIPVEIDGLRRDIMLTFGSLFAGIGGFDLGFEWAGMECRWQVEIDDYCTAVLEKHWPDVTRYRDVRKCGNHNLEPVDVICGGFPCQPFSAAGKRRGEADDRNLWPEFRRIIAEVRPRWVVAENVPGLRTLYLDTVLFDLEGLGYTTATTIIPACAFDAPHRRDRLWIVAHGDRRRCLQHNTRKRTISKPNSKCQAIKIGRAEAWLPEPDVGRVVTRISPWLDEPRDIPRVATGIPDRVNRLKALGNAVVPAVTEHIARMIVEIDGLSVHNLRSSRRRRPHEVTHE